MVASLRENLGDWDPDDWDSADWVDLWDRQIAGRRRGGPQEVPILDERSYAKLFAPAARPQAGASATLVLAEHLSRLINPLSGIAAGRSVAQIADGPSLDRGPEESIPAALGARVGGRLFPRIQNAINAALPMETIVIQPGMYRERLDVCKDVILTAGGGVGCVHVVGGDAPALKVSGGRVRCLGLVFDAGSGPAISLLAGRLDLIDCEVDGHGSCGIEASGRMVMMNTQLHDCDEAILLGSRSHVTVTGCEIIGNVGPCARMESASSLLEISDSRLHSWAGPAIQSNAPGTIAVSRTQLIGESDGVAIELVPGVHVDLHDVDFDGYGRLKGSI